MRILVAILSLIAVASTALAQSVVSVETSAGTVHRGELLDSDDQTVTIQLDSGPRTFQLSALEAFEVLSEEEAEGSAADPSMRQGGPAPKGAGDDAQDPAAHAGAAAAVSNRPSPTVRALGLLPARLSWLGERYLWLVPQGGVQIVSLLLLGLLLLGACIHLGAGAAGLEGRSLMRSLVFAALVLVLAGIQLAAIVPSPLALGLVIVGNAVVWFLTAKSLFGAGFFESATVFVMGALLVGVGFLVLEVVDFVMLVDSV